MFADNRILYFESQGPSKLLNWIMLALMCLAYPAAGAAEEGLASDAMVDKAGITVDWFAQSGIGPRDEIVDWDLNVNENKATTYFVVEAGNLREIISEYSPNAFGEAFGKDGAVQYIEIRKDVIAAELKNEGITDVEIKVDQFSLPETTIYLLTGEGLVVALDADTGRNKWTTQVGSGQFPAIGLGSDDKHVAAVVGSTIYCLDPANGKVIWSRRCKHAVSASPAVCEDYVYVPLLDGRMEALPIETKGLGSFLFVAQGAGTSRPMVTEKTVSWPTAKGDLNVAARFGDRNHALSYRLRANEAILSTPTFQSGLMFAASLDGFVYAIDEEEGSIRWEITTGEEISQSPFPVGNSVYAISDEGSLYGIEIESGEFKWRSPVKNVGRYLGASSDRLYVTDTFGQLLVINRVSGAILSRVNAGDIKYILPNYQTDRIYIASGTGIVQCLHEVASKRPYFHNGEFNAIAQPTEIQEGQPKPEMTAAENPFATADDKSKSSAPIVSGSDEDPFATSDDKPMADEVDEPENQPATEPENDPTMTTDDEVDPFAVDEDSTESKEEDQSDDDNAAPTEDDPFK